MKVEIAGPISRAINEFNKMLRLFVIEYIKYYVD